MQSHSPIWKFLVQKIFSIKLKKICLCQKKSNLKKYKLALKCKIFKYIGIFFLEKKCEFFKNRFRLRFKHDFFYLWYKKFTSKIDLKIENVYPIKKYSSKIKKIFFFGREIFTFEKNFSPKMGFFFKKQKIKIEKKNNFFSIFGLLFLEKNFLSRVFNFNIFYLSKTILVSNRKKIYFRKTCEFYLDLLNTMSVINKNLSNILNFSCSIIKYFLKNYENLLYSFYVSNKEKFFLKEKGIYF